MKNPRHKEYKSTVEWLGGKFDPDAFDIATVNTFLSKLKWPRVTQAQLRGLMMARDVVD